MTKTMQSRSGMAAQLVVRRLARFGRDESGVLVVFGLIIFVMMLLIGGMAVDLMRFETNRAKLQGTSDRAVLAAASLRQTGNPVAVVEDYFVKAGIDEYLTGVNVTSGINYRAVNADVLAEVPSFFMQMIGIDSIEAPASSTAEERIIDVEVSLVLDVSGSMNSSSRLVNLKVAARDFVDTVFAGDTENKISISLVPYNGQVNLGATVAPRYNLSTTHTFNTCADLPTALFNSTALSNTTLLARSDPIDPWSSNYRKPLVNTTNRQNYCSTDARLAVKPFQRNATTLKATINSLVAEGNTSIDLGMKWGMAMLDPGTQPVITSLIAAGAVPAYFAGRPYSLTRDDTARIIVLMSDGENTSQFTLHAAYKSGLSNVYRSTSGATNGNVTIYHAARAGTDKYYVLTPTQITGYQTGMWTNAVSGGVGATNLTWPAVWETYPVSYVARYWFANPLGVSVSTWTNTFQTSVGPTTKDAQLTAICNTAKVAGIRVFTVGFDAPAVGAAALSSCASSPGDYFNVTGTQIQAAFQAIARQITQLRLTQ